MLRFEPRLMSHPYSNNALFQPQQVRKHVYHDADNLDTAFDAGGKVSIGLTATTIVSQWTWSATLLQSSTVASKVGISTRKELKFTNTNLSYIYVSSSKSFSQRFVKTFVLYITTEAVGIHITQLSNL